MRHTWFECEKPCEVRHCKFCEGELGLCTICNGAEGSLPTECPGQVMSEDLQQRVINGETNFVGGEWVDD